MTDTLTEAEPKVEMKTYTVTADAVMLAVGRKANGQPEVVRLLHGHEINADPNDERILDLLAIKAVVLSNSDAAKRGARVSVRMVSKGMQGEEPLLPSAPLPADVPGTATVIPAT